MQYCSYLIRETLPKSYSFTIRVSHKSIQLLHLRYFHLLHQLFRYVRQYSKHKILNAINLNSKFYCQIIQRILLHSPFCLRKLMLDNTQIVNSCVFYSCSFKMNNYEVQLFFDISSQLYFQTLIKLPIDKYTFQINSQSLIKHSSMSSNKKPNYIIKKLGNSQPINFKSQTNQKRQGSIQRRQQIKEFLKDILSVISDQSRHEQPDTGNIQNTIRISNLDKIEDQQKYKKKFINMQDPRDVVLLHPFDFSMELDINEEGSENNKQFILNEPDYDKLILQVQQFLVEVCQSVISVSFNNLQKKFLTQNQAKDYAAKNIMLNLQSILSTIFQGIEKLGKNKENSVLKMMKKRIVQDADTILKTILDNLADYYPQAPSTGGTAKMRQAILNVNRAEDQENDFIYRNDIKIDKYLQFDKRNDQQAIIFKQSTDMQQYTGFIMEVINKAILTSQQVDNQDQGISRYQTFVKFSQSLFWMSQNKDFRKKLQQKDIKGKTENKEKVMKGENVQKHLTQYLNDLCVKNKANITNLLPKVNEEEEVQRLREQHKYDIGMKIPSYVKIFNKQDLKQKNFSAKSSAILRIMSKWADCLEEIFQKPQSVLQRVYHFKDVHNQLVLLTRQQKQRLYNNLKAEYTQVLSKFGALKQNCSLFSSQFLCSVSCNLNEVVKRYSQARSCCSKINAVLVTLMNKYLNILIHHLLRAGYQIKDQININLIGFRIGDLMRSKFTCNQSSFICLLKMLYILDTPEMSKVFKLVRIKNKLDSKDNNILINYLFMDKVQCQLQLSIQQVKEKQKNYYQFSHFVYELTRGKFGVIVQCAIMVTQHDPMISASMNKKYYESKKKKKSKRPKNINNNANASSDNKNIFICSNCKELILDQNMQQLKHQKSQQGNNTVLCVSCLIKEDNIQQYFEKASSFLKKYTVQAKIAKLKNYKELKQLSKKDNKMILVLNKKKYQFQPFKIWYHQREMKYFQIALSSEIVKDLKFNSKTLDYIDITKKIINEEQIAQDQIRSTTLSKQLSKDLNMNFQQILIFLQQFEKFRIEKLLVKSLRQKNQIVYFSHDQNKYKLFNQIMQVRADKSIENNLHYLSGHLKCQSVKNIYAQKIALKDIPKWINQFMHLKSLDLSQNNLKNVEELLPLTNLDNLTHLDLSSNKITKFQVKDNMRNLTVLNLSSNLLKSVNLSNLTSLTNLFLGSNKNLASVELSSLTELTILNLSSCNFTNVDFLSNLTSLTTLNLSDNASLATVDLSNLTNLINANLSSNKNLASLNLISLTNLAILNLDQCNFSKINFLSSLINLNTLSLSSNKNLAQVDLSGLTSLTTLNLSDNAKLSRVDLSSLKSLINANLGSNKNLTTVDLSNLTNLTTLYLDSNKNLDTIDLSSLTSLTILNLDQCNFKNVDFLSGLKSLTTLFLGSNKNLVNANLSSLTCLVTLDLSYNANLGTIDLSGLTSLTTLDLNSCNLINVDFLSGLTKLTDLDLSSNKHLAFVDLSRLASLTTLNLSDNENLVLINIASLDIRMKIIAMNVERSLVEQIRCKYPKVQIIDQQQSD